ncbi:energy-coupling factor ABC transporter ATP-binding protein [Methanofervidicoccus abyssi]|uniref:Molybdate/tungstate import ATP-binding protein WtpC n=1 Tax=Methanofervidicoccus abyssi TaxID=2082189 RepID=A0A401HR31_9EURY|nr:phosphate ABC transporter ATP-binding protein [Methanofervidicoccus abyssi]GBF36665.1 tungstate transport system ATP-binding protein [Methanofervidicoccus abyssi]
MMVLKGIFKTFGDKIVLKDVNLTVNKGEIFAILGYSGAGKTTLLKILSALDVDFRGIYLFKDIDVRKYPEKVRKYITMVFQNPVMFKGTVFENVAYGLKVRGYSKNYIKEKVDRVLESLGILELRDKNAKRLSGGERQRVGIARALVLDVDVYIFDEPTSNLDIENIKVIEGAIKELKKKGKTIIVTTHDLLQARRLSDRVAYIEKGEIVEVGETEKVFKYPKDERTYRFVSGMF